MTSISQQTQIPPTASNTISASQSTQSYASATKKAVSSPPIATSSSSQIPAVAVSSTAPVQQNVAKSSSVSPVNGRAAITPAVPVMSAPAIAHSSSGPSNGNPNDHSRKSSVTINANGGYISNGGPVGGQKAGIPQFGSITDSPAASHSVPQMVQSTASAPIPIPANPRVISPAQSPSPIPQPAASGGPRPPNALSTNGMTFGSLPGDGDRQMRPTPIPHGPVAPGAPGAPGAQSGHDRRGSNAGESGLSGHNRGGFQPQGGRGRGGYNTNPSYPNQQMGYPGANNQFRGPPSQGRGGMASQFNNRGGPMQQYPNSPHQPTRSPALANSMPGTPNMGQAMPMQPPQQYGGYPTYHMGGPQVHPHSTYDHPPISFKQGKNKHDKYGPHGQQSQQKFNKPDVQANRSGAPSNEPQKELSDRILQNVEQKISERSQRSISSGPYFFPSLPDLRPFLGGQKIDLSPESGNFEKIILTTQQNYGAFPAQAYDRNTGLPIPAPYTMYPQMQYMQGMQGMPGMPQSPQPNFQQPYSVGQYNQPQPQAMSREHSQRSDRPNSSLGQPQTPSMPASTAGTLAPQPKAAVTTSSAFQRTSRKSAAIVIKNADGEIIQLPTTKAPASPAPSNRSRTPEVITSAPTPPPKSMTPLQQIRTDSPAIKSQEQIRLEFKEQMKKAAEADSKIADAKAVDNDSATATQSLIEQDVNTKEETNLEDEAKTVDNAKIAADEKAAAEAEAEAAAATAAAATAATAAAAVAAAAAKAKQDEEDELERQIQEMEEADARREKEQAERMAKRTAEKAALEKENVEKNKLAAAENDRKLREQEREMERLEDERERKRLEAESKTQADDDAKTDVDSAEVKEENKEIASEESADAKKEAPATPNTLASKLSNLSLSGGGGGGGDSGASTPASDDSMGPPPKLTPGEKKVKPAALNLAPLNTKPIEPPQPSAALQSLKSARFLTVMNPAIYPPNINSPNPALNSAVMSKGKSFKYDKEFLLQFQKVFTEKPSLEFESQIKVLIGDGEGGSARPGSSKTPGGMGPRQASNRKLPGEFVMGFFAAGSGKTLPPGTTSDQRYAMASGTLPRPTINNNPLASFNRPGGAFPNSTPMTRVPSSSNMGSMPQSPRNQRGNNSQRQSSKRDFIKDSKAEAQAAKTMPLTAGMDVKPIHISASGWKPRTIMGASPATGAAGPTPGDSGHMQPEMVQRKVKAALNKMTPEKFDKIADQILAIAAQSKDEADGRTLRQVIQLTFEKATDEAHWASMYAKFCKRMLETMSSDIKDESILDKNGNVVSGGNLFRKYLLNRCQEEFERGWKTDLGEKPEGEEDEEKTAEAAMLSDAYYIAAAAKRRGLGLVQFIGELYKLGMLTERIMHECVKKLVDYTGIPDEAEIESLTKLLKTIGGNLDSTEKGKPMMDVYFSRIQSMIDTPDLPSRLKFMLMDIVDLRKNHWHSKEDNKGPKTLEEVRQEAEDTAKAKAQEAARSSRGGGGGSGRMQIGRGDSRNFSGGYSNQPPIDYSKNTVATDDLRRLTNKGATRQAGGATMSFGPSSMFSSQSRSNSGKGKMGPGGSLSRTGEESGASSRTGTPPQQKEKETSTSVNAFSLLEGLNDSNETENPASPPPNIISPELSKAIPAPAEPSDKPSEEKKESDA